MAIQPIEFNLKYPALQPVGVMWSSITELACARDFLLTNPGVAALDSLRPYLPETRVALDNVFNVHVYSIITLVYAPQILSLQVYAELREKFFMDYCYKCNYRSSLACYGGANNLINDNCRILEYFDEDDIRVECPMPWLFASFTLPTIPHKYSGYVDNPRILYLTTPVGGDNTYTTAITVFTGNTNTSGSLCLGNYIDEEGALSDLFMNRNPDYFDASQALALILGRQFNTDYSVPMGDTATWLAKLAQVNTPETIFREKFSYKAVTAFPSGPKNAYMASPDETLLSIRLDESGNATIKTTQGIKCP